jgi:hypothetical protein
VPRRLSVGINPLRSCIMRAPSFIGVLGAAILGIGMAQAQAAPAAPDRALAPAQGPIVRVQWHCDPLRCIDLRSGAYTQSGCNRRGCYPISGIVGYTDPGSLGLGYGSDFPPGAYRGHYQRRWDHRYYGD